MGTLNDLPKFFLMGTKGMAELPYRAEEGWRVWLFKGSKSAAKSLVMKKLASALQDQGRSVTLIPDLYDPKSLCGVFLDEEKAAFLNGDGPGYLPEEHPGVCEQIVDFGGLTDRKILRPFHARVIEKAEAANRLERRSGAFISAAAALLDDNRKFAAECADLYKAEKFAVGLGERLIPQGTGARESVRFLSGITPVGQMFYRSTVAKLCSEVYSIHDEWGGVSGVVMEKLRQKALEKGQWVITCVCPLFSNDKIEHLLLPEAGLAFVTTNRYLEEIESLRHYHVRRFTDETALRRHTQRLKFCKKAAKDLLDSAAGLRSGAAAEREQMTGYYNAATDFDALPALVENLITAV